MHVLRRHRRGRFRLGWQGSRILSAFANVSDCRVLDLKTVFMQGRAQLFVKGEGSGQEVKFRQIWGSLEPEIFEFFLKSAA